MPAMGFNMGCLQSASSMNSIMPGVTSISSSLSAPAPPYGSPSHSSSHYPIYGKDSMAGYPGCMTSSIASLRLKAKQHQATGYSSYSPQPPPLSPRSSSNPLSACQYNLAPDRPLI